MKIICKTTLLPVPAPTFRGTEIGIVTTSDSPTFGIFLAFLADGHESGTLDWGDGKVTVITPDVTRFTHTYETPGAYTVRISDDIGKLEISCHLANEFYRIYAPLIQSVEVVSNNVILWNAFVRGASALTSVNLAYCATAELPNRAFLRCTSLERIELPNIETVDAVMSDAAKPFTDCAALREIVFSAAHRESIMASEGWLSDPTLGAPNAQIVFR